jgi:hypothetical protein
MSEEEIEKAYPEPVDFVGLQSFRFWACSSQFEIPYIYIAQQLILDIDSGKLKYPLRTESQAAEALQSPQVPPSSAPDIESIYGPQLASDLQLVAHSAYGSLMTDLHATIDFNFGNFEDGYYFKAFHNPDLSQFIFQRTDLIPHLKQLRENGVKLFLMTNSNHHYTNALMTYAYGSEWKELFDLIIYRSRKPQFFLLNNPFLRIVDRSLPGETNGVKVMEDGEPLELGGEYYGGNLVKLRRDLLGDAPVTYVGDELFGDVVAPSSYAGWATIAVVEELQEAEEKAGWQNPKSEIRLEKTSANLSLERWGNYFHCTGQRPRLTFYGALMHHFADIAIPCVSRLAHFEAGDLFLPHHPHSQGSATRDPEQKRRTTIYITESASPDLPDNFRVPNKGAMLRNGELLKVLKDLRSTPSAVSKS